MNQMYISNKEKFISFEGIDGCGKSTQARSLIGKLNDNGISTCLVREPGGTPVSEEIRSVLLKNRGEKMCHRTEALLMTGSRAQLTNDVIIPALEKGEWVVADRYTDSTLAYQGGGEEPHRPPQVMAHLGTARCARISSGRCEDRASRRSRLCPPDDCTPVSAQVVRRLTGRMMHRFVLPTPPPWPSKKWRRKLNVILSTQW